MDSSFNNAGGIVDIFDTGNCTTDRQADQCRFLIVNPGGKLTDAAGIINTVDGTIVVGPGPRSPTSARQNHGYITII